MPQEEDAGGRRDGRLEALAAAFPDYAFVYDADGVYRDVLIGQEPNERRYTEADILGESVHNLFPEATASAIQSAIDEALATGEVARVEYAIDEPDGRHWFEGRAAPLPEDVHGERGVVLAARDVTDRREYERLLEAQNERLDRFTAMVSHDLRNPLNVAQGRLELTMDAGDVGPEAAAHLSSLREALDRMTRMVDDLLEMARTGLHLLDQQPVDLEAAVTAAWEAVGTQAATLDVETSLGRVTADPDYLSRLLENLLRNSVEHGGPDVVVTVGQTDRGFFVADDGPGISGEDRAVLLAGGESGTGRQAGFGLAVVREVADAHGWTVEVGEGEAGGARFDVTGVAFP